MLCKKNYCYNDNKWRKKDMLNDRQMHVIDLLNDKKMDSMSWKQISTKYSEIILMVL